MTPKEAIKLLHPDTTREAIWEIGENGENAIKAVEEACIVACEALEKQVPVEVETIEGDEYHCSSVHCPRCGNMKSFGDKYCVNCGQKLKWGEEDKQTE